MRHVGVVVMVMVGAEEGVVGVIIFVGEGSGGIVMLVVCCGARFGGNGVRS